jgi:hypothetical protein
VQSWDCDRIPSLAALDATTGRPVTAFGAGGFALQSAVGWIATLAPDGSGWVTERRADFTLWPGHRSVPDPTALRRLDAAGRYVRTVPVSPPGISSLRVESLFALDDGSLLVSGRAAPGWIAKLSPDGAFDPAFGSGGVAVPQPGVTGTVNIVGVRPDGRIAIHYMPDGVHPRGVALLHPNGSLDTTYATAVAGFRELSGIVSLPGVSGNPLDSVPVTSTATPFLDADRSIRIAAASLHSSDSEPPVHFGLRRILPNGDYDMNFGLGGPSVALNTLPAGRLTQLAEPVGTSSGREAFSAVAAVGVAWMGGRLYVVANATAGNVAFSSDTSPAYQVLVVIGSQSDGSRDNGFASSGVQEAGFDPDRLDFSPRGVLRRFDDEIVVYGEAGRTETLTHQVGDGPPYTVTNVRRPEPALFRVSYPAGLVMTASGQAAVEVFPVQEFKAALITARLFPASRPRVSDRVRFVCNDASGQPELPRDPTTTFGGVGQFALPRPVLWPI